MYYIFGNVIGRDLTDDVKTEPFPKYLQEKSIAPSYAVVNFFFYLFIGVKNFDMEEQLANMQKVLVAPKLCALRKMLIVPETKIVG